MHPVLFTLGPLTVYFYGVMLALAFVAGIWVASWRAKRENVSPDVIYDLALISLICGILGARLLFVLLNLGYYAQHPLEIVMFWQGGLVYYGGIILAALAVIVFLKIRKLNMGKVVDICIPSIALGQAIGRIGCFLNGCCFGRPVSWGIEFPPGSIVSYEQWAQGLIGSAGRYSLPVHPTQLYSSLNALIIFLILIIVDKRKNFGGELFWLYLLLYSITRFAVEFLRGDDRGPIFFGFFSISQLIGVGIFLLSSVVFGLLSRKRAESI
jgi:phosphatidylglycerol:prolipoprotein diacylglycerol transferase